MLRLDLPVYATFSLLAGPVMYVTGFRDLRIRRMIENTPTARIRSMAMGLVEVQGAVLERSQIAAPFSGNRCAYWEVDIAVRSNRRNGWVTVHRRSSGQPFFVDDGTGLALVYPEGSQCRVPSGSEEECQGFGLPDCYESYMAEQNLWQRHLWRLSGMRFRERMLVEGQHVFILGSAEPRAQSSDIANPEDGLTPEHAVPWIEPDLEATGTDGAVTSAPRVPGLSVVPAAAMLRAGSLGAGQATDAFAASGAVPGLTWARDGARVSVRSQDPAAPLVPLPGPARLRALQSRVSAVIRRGTNDPTFLISAESMTAVETSLALSTLGKLIGGVMLTLFGLGFWLMWLSAHNLSR